MIEAHAPIPRSLRLGLLVAVLSAGTAAADAAAVQRPADRPGHPARSLAYEITVHPGRDSLELHVEARFRGEASGVTTLILPSHWGGQETLFEGIRDLRAEGGSLRETDADHRRSLVHDPGANLRLTYRFVQDRPADFSDHGRTHRPLLEPEYFHFVGHGAFVAPDWPVEKPRPVSLSWRGVPEGWMLAHSFGTGSAPVQTEISIEQLRHALYVGGDFRIHRLLIHDRPVTVGLRGDWPFTDLEYTSLVAGIVRSQREFWNDHDFPHFLITMIPMETACCSFGGTSVTHAFATFIATDDGLDMRMKHLLAHELMHTWIGQRMRTHSSPDEPESLLYWFSEGFTDYYTRELLLRAGLIDEDGYLEDLNRALYDYWISPVRNEPNSRIAEDYWNDRHVQKLPYLRGELLARRWDTAIRRRSGGKATLDDLMRDLLKAASSGSDPGAAGLQAGPATDRTGPGEEDEGGARRITHELLAEAARNHAGPGARLDLEAFVRRGETIPPSRGALPEDIILTQVELAPFELGFDFDASRGSGEIRGVRQGGPAWEAGLREGQPLRGFGIHWDDARLPVTIHVEVDGESKKVEYLPQGVSLMVPQFNRPASGPAR